MFVLPEVPFTVTAFGQQAGTMHVMLLSEQGLKVWTAGDSTNGERAFSVDGEGSMSEMTFESGGSTQLYTITKENLGESDGNQDPHRGRVRRKSRDYSIG